ncbi:hypothetical protein EYF80_025855 [Liparis tanakae]|uniref:Uncharacterized protein n=1 Tax=Liparis tanakae TaxID=230148 RepID=A0A4Z2HGF7_9TELE|nr:hypothetical protein EYF80_025855 [Liparis tanakae]
MGRWRDLEFNMDELKSQTKGIRRFPALRVLLENRRKMATELPQGYKSLRCANSICALGEVESVLGPSHHAVALTAIGITMATEFLPESEAVEKRQEEEGRTINVAFRTSVPAPRLWTLLPCGGGTHLDRDIFSPETYGGSELWSGPSHVKENTTAPSPPARAHPPLN